MPVTAAHHIILSDTEWRCAINALDVFEKVMDGEDLDLDVIRDLKFFFPPSVVTATQRKLN